MWFHYGCLRAWCSSFVICYDTIIMSCYICLDHITTFLRFHPLSLSLSVCANDSNVQLTNLQGWCDAVKPTRSKDSEEKLQHCLKSQLGLITVITKSILRLSSLLLMIYFRKCSIHATQCYWYEAELWCSNSLLDVWQTILWFATWCQCNKVQDHHTESTLSSLYYNIFNQSTAF